MKPRHCNDALLEAIVLGTKETIVRADRQLMVNHEENVSVHGLEVEAHLVFVDAHSASY